jgi:hypothetical protein
MAAYNFTYHNIPIHRDKISQIERIIEELYPFIEFKLDYGDPDDIGTWVWETKGDQSKFFNQIKDIAYRALSPQQKRQFNEQKFKDRISWVIGERLLELHNQRIQG